MQIKAPDLGVESADVSEILVKVGDRIEQEQSLLVLESAKASVEVPSPASGVVKSIAIKTGQTVQQGDVLFELDSGDAADAKEPNAKADNSDGDRDGGDDGTTVADDKKSDAKHTEAKSSDITDSETNDSEANHAERSEVDSDVDHDLDQSNTTERQNHDVTVPDMGVDEADVSELLVKVGDSVEKEQSLVVLESAKASVEVPSPFSGVVTEIALKTGQKVKQGTLILTIKSDGSTGDTPSKAAQSTDSNQSDSHTTHQPASGSSKNSKPSAASKSDSQSVAKADTSNSAADSKKDSAAKPSSSAEAAPAALSAEQAKANSEMYAGPAVRQLARQLGVALSQVKATGTNKRILKEDVFAFVKTNLNNADTDSKPAPTNQPVATGLPPLPNFEKFGGSRTQAMTRLQQVSVPQLSLNNYIPQVTQFDLADITELENWRNQLKADYKKQQISLTILAFIVKAIAYLLKQEPTFNSHLADDQKSILLRHEIHMGIAVATEDGLTVPVLRHPDRLSIKDIALQLGELSQKARDKKLKPQDLQGASFTITSLGSIGGTAFTPLVNWPQVAILGISPAQMQPVWNGHEFAPRLMLPLSLSYDHRVINGADAARFSHVLSELLGDIRRILL